MSARKQVKYAQNYKVVLKSHVQRERERKY